MDKRPLDLYRLKKTVERKGGFEQVCKGKRWAEVGRDLGYSGKIMSSLSTSLKNSYQKWLLPYEEYLRLAKPGVQQQLEMLHGGPYTPSPGQSPVKKSDENTPSVHEDTIRASTALNANLSDHSPHPLTQQSPPPTAPAHGGFTAVNAGSFTPVNIPRASTPAGAASTPTPSYTVVNGSNGYHAQSMNGTPHMSPNTSSACVGATNPSTNGAANGPQLIAPHPNGVEALKRQHSENILTPEEIEAMNRRSKRLRKDVPTVAGSNMHHSRMAASRFQPNRDRGSMKPGEVCENCLRPEEKLQLIECYTCDCVFHMHCLEPPLKQKPDYEWHCPRCLVGTNDYGFEEGDVYSLGGFQKRASEFKTHHFNSIPRQFSPFSETKHHLTEDDIEREFWRLVEDISDTTEVEYGADIHSTTHGSGFPTIEKQPRNPYSADPWNLNILPLDKESLFRHIKSDVSGMTVPWLYVGMVFSTFCWHNEDHFTYSANYQHFGETKTWYGIPGEDSYKFEQAMREEVPELFETQPDLLFQLVTLARPEKLRKAGVRVFALDQHAGQFVVTFPRAYHAGFNHGFNFNEAVNFAPHDWEPYGQEGVKRLREYRKQPCFSHDEMLLTAASRDHAIKTAKWLAPALERMRDDELSMRREFLETPKPDSDAEAEELYTGPRYKNKPATIGPELEEEEAICVFCKSYCYLSRYRCAKTNKIMCLLHAGGYQCCDGLEFERYSGVTEANYACHINATDNHILEYRMTDETLRSTVQKVVDKATVPEVWMTKVDNELDGNIRPSFKKLRTLLTEGEKIQYELPQLADLRRFVERCGEWVEKATNYITRKQQNRRKNDRVWRKGAAKAAEAERSEKELRNLESIHKLLDDADNIGFDCDEIDTLRKRAQDILDFQREAHEACHVIRSKTTAFFEELVERGKEFHVDIPEIETLEHIIRRVKWDDMAKLKRPDPETRSQTQTLGDIEAFIAEGVMLGVTENNADLVFFREHKAQAELWETKAKELMAVEPVHYQQLDSLSTQAANLPVSAGTLARVDQILRKQREVQEKIISLVEQAQNADFRLRPTYQDMLSVVKALDELQSKPNGTSDLERLQKSHEDWMRKGKKLFGKANAPLHILKQHMRLVEQRNESCFDLADKPRMPVEPSSRANSPSSGELPVADGSASSRDVFCICRKPEAGMMIECELCHEWYHGKCLKIARGKVKEDDKYTCPICDWRVKIPRDAGRPKLEDLQKWYDELETLPFQPEEESTLANIVDHGGAFREFMKPFINPENPTTPEEIGVLRFHLRKIEGADILLAEETNYLRQELHKWAPVAPEAPIPVEISMSTRKPRPTKQQKLMAQLGIANPDDLPQHYKMKSHNNPKRKGSELLTGTPRPALQPAGSSASPAAAPSPGQPSTSVITPIAPNGKFYTALSLQVLGDLANAPVVSPMLQQEKHMNSEKLTKMKHLLQTDRSVWDDVDAMRRRLANYTPTTNGGPSFSYGATNYVPNHSVNTVKSSQREPAMFSTATPTEPGSSQHSRLGSPPLFGAPQPYGSNTSPVPGPSYDTHMFDHGPGSSMFDSPGGSAMQMKHAGPSDTSPEFDRRGTGIYDSPRPVGSQHSGLLNSPAFDGSQPSGSNLDNVFADFVADHDVTMGGADTSGALGATVKEQAAAALAAAGLATEAQRPEDEMSATSQQASGTVSPPSAVLDPALDPALSAPAHAVAGSELERDRDVTMSEFVHE